MISKVTSFEAGLYKLGLMTVYPLYYYELYLFTLLAKYVDFMESS